MLAFINQFKPRLYEVKGLTGERYSCDLSKGKFIERAKVLSGCKIHQGVFELLVEDKKG